MRSINHCLNPQLREICQRAIQLDELNSKIKDYLTPLLAEHCQVGSFSKGCLLITTTNQSWATELRYSLPTLRDRLRTEAGLYQLISIKIHVADYQEQRLPTKNRKTITLSETARRSLQKAGEQCTDPALKKALYKLANGQHNM